jgi:hypothetical protein
MEDKGRTRRFSGGVKVEQTDWEIQSRPKAAGRFVEGGKKGV